MAIIKLKSGGSLDTESLPDDGDELIALISNSDPILDELTGDEGSADPASFRWWRR